MNVAIILTGQFREYREVYDNFDKYILQDLQPDVFIHTWTNLGLNTGRYQFDTEEQLDITDVMEKYRPAAICVEDPKQVEIDVSRFAATNHTVPISNIVNMFRKTYLGGSLVTVTGKEYDLVIKARPDIMFEESIPADELLRPALHVPDQSNLQICDHLAFGSTLDIVMYCDLYGHLDRYYNPKLITPNTDPNGSPLHAESLLYKHLINRQDFARDVWEPNVQSTNWNYHIPHKKRGM